MHGLHKLQNNHDSVNFGEIEITNGVAVFAYGDHAHDQRTRRSLSSLLSCMLGVAVDWKMEQQNCISTCSTDSEIHSTFSGTKRALYYFDITTFLKMVCAGLPVTVYQDSQPCIDICESGAVSKRVKHVAVPILFINEKLVKGYIKFKKIPTALQPAEPGTKSLSAPVIFRAYDYAYGTRFYPPPNTVHAELMDLTSFNNQRNFRIPNKNQTKLTKVPKSEQPLL